jgi:hypothetical protein
MSIFEPWAGQRVGQIKPEFASSVVEKLQARNRRQSFDEGTTAVQTQKPARVRAQKPPKYKPVKLSEENQMEQSTVVAPEPSQTVVGKVPVKPKGKNPTAPGTKPKPKKK